MALRIATEVLDIVINQRQTSSHEKSARASVLEHLLQNFLAGVMISAAVVWATFFGGAGTGQALLELKHHVLFVHPLLWALTLVVVCAVIVAQGAARLPALGTWVISPFFRFVAHVFGAALGAIPVIVLAKVLGVLGTSGPPTEYAVVAVAMGMSLLLSIMALVGIEAATRPNLPVRPVAQWMAFIGLVVGIPLVVRISAKPSPSEVLITDFARYLFGQLPTP